MGRLIDDAARIDPRWLEGVSTVGVTAGASAPEDLVQGVLARLVALGGVVEERVVVPERVAFPLPPELTRSGAEERT
jgi:4-hydroxy-3-methylbut-2-enyl diphosphate reductase